MALQIRPGCRALHQDALQAAEKVFFQMRNSPTRYLIRKSQTPLLGSAGASPGVLGSTSFRLVTACSPSVISPAGRRELEQGGRLYRRVRQDCTYEKRGVPTLLGRIVIVVAGNQSW
jgi:hypothetical protein